MNKEDGLPNQICVTCEMKLKSFANFRIVCAQTDIALKRKIDENVEFKQELLYFDESSNFSVHSFFENKLDESDDQSKQDCLVELVEDCAVNIKKEDFTPERPYSNKDNAKHISSEIIDTSELKSPNKNPIHFKGMLIGYENRDEAKFTYRCKVCEKKFSYKRTLQKHSQIHLKIKNLNTFKCDICGKSYLRENIFNKHKIKCTGTIKTYPCDTCNKQFKSKYKLKEHMYTHMKGNSFTCEICGKYYKTKSILKKHTFRIHGKNNKQQCNICGKILSYQGYWVRVIIWSFICIFIQNYKISN